MSLNFQIVPPRPPEKAQAKSEQRGGQRLKLAEREWFTISQAADYLGFSISQIHKWRATGKLPAYSGHGVKGPRFRKEDLIKLMEEI